MPATRMEYPAAVTEYARRLHDDLGYDMPRIRQALAKLGHTPAWNTVLCWVDPDYAFARRDAHKHRMRKLRRQVGATKRVRISAWEQRFGWMRELRDEVGLSYRSIAALMNHEFEGLSLTDEQVRNLLNGSTSARLAKLRLAPEAVSA